MITPLRFFWSKILPISYDNYLSETEILEYMRSKFNDIIMELNKISEYIEKDLADDIKKIADQEINDHYKDVVLPQIEDLQTQIDQINITIGQLQGALGAGLDELKKLIQKNADAIEEMDRRHLELLAQLDSKIQDQLISLQNQLKALDARIDANWSMLELELSNAKKEWLRLLNRQYRILTQYIREYFNKLASTNIMVINPWTTKQQTLQDFINDLFMRMSKGLTAYEYRALNLTAREYRLLYLTAREYRLYGISNAEGRPDPVKMYDLSGREVEQPLSSVWATFGHGVDAVMQGWEITAGQYRELGLSDYDLEKWGLYYLSNHGKSVYKDTIHLTADTIIATFAQGQTVTEISGILKVDEDNGIVPTQELLTDESIAKLIKNVDVEIPNRDGGSWDITGWTYTLVDTGIAFNAKLKSTCYYADPETGSKPSDVVIDVTAITTSGMYN